jgi:hypothetical protein
MDATGKPAAPAVPQSDMFTPVPPAKPKDAPTSRGRRALLAVVFVLACISVVLSTIAVWTHQVAFNTDRFTALVEKVVTDPAIIDPVSERISTQVVDAIDVEARLAARLPDALKPLAGTIALAIQDGIDKRLRVVLADPRTQDALVTSLSFSHEQVMRLLRDEAENVNVVNGYVTLDVFPIVGKALEQLQASGIIPPEVVLPDLSQPVEPGPLAQRLGAALGVTLPDDFGTIQLMPADNLLTARTAVKAFDLIVVLLLILSVVLLALSLFLSRNRRHMIIYLAIGTFVAFLIARFAIRTIEDVLVGGIANLGVAGMVRTAMDATFEDLRSLTLLVLLGVAIVGIVAYLTGKPAWVSTATTAATSAASGAASRAGSTAAKPAPTATAPAPVAPAPTPPAPPPGTTPPPTPDAPADSDTPTTKG